MIAFDSSMGTCDSGCPHSVYAVDPDGSAPRLLASRSETPSWSADGTRLAYASSSLIGADIFVREPDGTRLQLTDNSPFVFDGQPAWSPDGSRIAFVSSRSGQFEIYVMNADGSEETRVTDSRADGFGLDATEPAWSPDGSRIAFTRNIRNPHVNDYEIYVMNPDGTDLRRLTFNLTPDSLYSDRNDSNPDWSPDGSRIVFASERGDSSEIYSMDADGGDLRRLTEQPTRTIEPVLSPDGGKIAFISSPHHVFTMNADGTAVTDITPALGVDNRSPNWQPLPGPKRSDFKNANQFCKAEQNFWGDQFASRYGGGANAFGKCVSQNH